MNAVVFRYLDWFRKGSLSILLCTCEHVCMWRRAYKRMTSCVKKRQVKASFYIAQYPVLRTIQSALHFTSLTNLFTQTPSQLLWEASSHMLQLMREGCSYTYPPLSIVRYSFIQLSELEQCRVTKLAQGFNTAAQDSNPGSRNRESEDLPLSHCALCVRFSSLSVSAIFNRNLYLQIRLISHIYVQTYTSVS